MNWELPDVQAGFRKGQWYDCQNQLDHAKRKRVPKKIYFCFIEYAKAFDCVNHNKLWKIFEERGISDHLTCLLRNLCLVKKQQLEPHMEQWTCSKLGKEYVKAVYCHLAYLTYTECIIWNTRLDEAQAGIKIAGRNINNVWNANGTNFMAESKEELKMKKLEWKLA